jgi:hypothetical protein
MRLPSESIVSIEFIEKYRTIHIRELSDLFCKKYSATLIAGSGRNWLCSFYFFSHFTNKEDWRYLSSLLLLYTKGEWVIISLLCILMSMIGRHFLQVPFKAVSFFPAKSWYRQKCYWITHCHHNSLHSNKNLILYIVRSEGAYNQNK